MFGPQGGTLIPVVDGKKCMLVHSVQIPSINMWHQIWSLPLPAAPEIIPMYKVKNKL